MPTWQYGRYRNPIEQRILQAGIHLFVEKPLSVKSADEVAGLAEELGKLQKEQNLIIAVGYMLRYSPAIQVCP